MTIRLGVEPTTALVGARPTRRPVTGAVRCTTSARRCQEGARRSPVRSIGARGLVKGPLPFVV
jgi:hypothetical protein